MSKPVLLCLHAITRSGADMGAFRALLPVLSDAPDLIGHGTAPRSTQYRLSDYADALEGHLTGPTVLYGHSLGGLVACHLAARHPEYVTAVVLEDPPLFAIAPSRFAADGNAAAFADLAALLEVSTADTLAPVLAPRPSGYRGLTLQDAIGPQGVAERAAALAQTDPHALRAPGTSAFLGPETPAQLLARVSCTVHLLAGHTAHGGVLSAEDQTAFLDLSPNATLHRFDDLGHDIRTFAPGPCAQLVASLAA